MNSVTANKTTRRYLQYLLILVAFHSQHQVADSFTSHSSSLISSTRNSIVVNKDNATPLTLPTSTSTAISAATVSTATSTDESSRRRRRWHRRVWSRIVRRSSGPGRSSRSDSPVATATAPLQSTATALTYDEIEQETNFLLDTITLYRPSSSSGVNRKKQDNQADSGRFILSGFEDKTPNEVLPLVGVEEDEEGSNSLTSVVDSEFFDVSITTTSPATTPVANSSNNNKVISISRLMAMLIENIVSNRIVRHSIESPEGLEVQVVPTLDTVGRLFSRFQFMADVHITAYDRLIFPNIRFTKDRLLAEQMTINLMGFIQSRRESSIKYPHQFDIHADGLTMTRNDLSDSSCIRNGLRRLLVRILKDRGIESSSIKITSIDILVRG